MLHAAHVTDGTGAGELEALKTRVPQLSRISLGDGGVLRAETAAIAALSILASHACLSLGDARAAHD